VNAIDIVFILDESDSVSWAEFALMRLFLSRFVSALDIDSGHTRVGLATYASFVGQSINLNNHSSRASLQSAISSLRYLGGSTNTAAALGYVRTQMLTSAAGDRSNVPDVIILLTDGQSDDRRATQVCRVVWTRAFRFVEKKIRFDSVRFTLTNRFFDSIRFDSTI